MVFYEQVIQDALLRMICLEYKIPCVDITAEYQALQHQLNTFPNTELVAIRHLLSFPIRSLKLFGITFFQEPYYENYLGNGANAKHWKNDRPPKKIDLHQLDVQFAYFLKYFINDSRLVIDQFCLDHGVHVFVEKPITLVVEEANILISLAKRKGLVLQCGHIEHFNPGFKFVRPQLSCPVFVETQRFAPFKTRGSDISVIFDLMIHHLDIILSIVDSRITSIEAVGANVFTAFFDFAKVKITFANGCIAKLAVSRVHASSVRTLSIFQEEDCFYIDMNNNSCNINPMNSAAAISKEISLAKMDALEEELSDYLEAIASKRSPIVSGEDARNALALAIQIYDIIGLHSYK